MYKLTSMFYAILNSMDIRKQVKFTQEEINRVNLRSTEVNDILGHIPSRIIRYGISSIAIILFLALGFSFFFKYPDIINGNFYLQSANAPAFMLARSTGKIQSLLVKDKDEVIKGQLLATIENSTSFEAYKKLLFTINNIENEPLISIPNLGELQASYSNYTKAYKEFSMFNQIDYHTVKINSLKQQKTELEQNIKLQESQVASSTQKMALSIKRFKRDSLLYVDNTIPAVEYEKASQALLEQKMSLTNSKIQLSNSKSSLSSLDQQILELNLNSQQQNNSLKVNLESAYNMLIGSINTWEDKYCLKSPINGRVSFSEIWEVNQNIRSGQLVMSILPKQASRIIAKIIIPIDRAGKIKPGQEVNLKLYDYPFREFGMIVSKLNSISEVPDSAYIGTIFLNDSLITNYNRYLPFKQNMQGKAEIITEDITLAERLITPIRDIIKSHVSL